MDRRKNGREDEGGRRRLDIARIAPRLGLRGNRAAVAIDPEFRQGHRQRDDLRGFGNFRRGAPSRD